MGVQWNHCLRTYCNKNFRGWIAGSNPFCRLIEIRTPGYPGAATGSYSPLKGINRPNIDYWQTIKDKNIYIYIYICYIYIYDSMARAPRRFEPWCGHRTASARRQPDSLKAIWPQRLPLACVGLSCLCCNVLGPKFKKKCRDLKSFFFPPPPLEPKTTPKWTFKPWHDGISSPELCLACTWKNFSGPKHFFSNQLFSERPGMVGYLALNSVCLAPEKLFGA